LDTEQVRREWVNFKRFIIFYIFQKLISCKTKTTENSKIVFHLITSNSEVCRYFLYLQKEKKTETISKEVRSKKKREDIRVLSNQLLLDFSRLFSHCLTFFFDFSLSFIVRICVFMLSWDQKKKDIKWSNLPIACLIFNSAHSSVLFLQS
jgi:hypothetical protein